MDTNKTPALHGLSSGDLLGLVRDACNDRSFEKIARRLLKASEELGEASQAYLRTTGHAAKRMTIAELREEIVDFNVVGLDLLLHRLPGEEALSEEEFAQMLLEIFKAKLAKWRKNQAAALLAA